MSTERIASIRLDDESIPERSPEIEHELKIAIADLLHENQFTPVGMQNGPYHVMLKTEEQRLVFEIAPADAPDAKKKVALPVQSFKRLIRDYFIICESYYAALKSSTPGKLEAIDMGRRGMHNEAAEALKDQLEGKIDVDFCTARRLFTLICALHMK